MMDKRRKEEKYNGKMKYCAVWRKKTTNDDENGVQGEGADGWGALVSTSSSVSWPLQGLGFLQVFFFICFFLMCVAHLTFSSSFELMCHFML